MGAFVWWDYYHQFGRAGARGHVVIDQPPSDWQSDTIPQGLISFGMLRDWHRRLQTERNELVREIIPMMFASQQCQTDLRWMFDDMTRAPEVIAAAVLFDQSTREYQQQLTDYTVPT